MKDKTIEQVAGCVTLHVELPPALMRWAVRRAKAEGHNDVSANLRRGVDLLMQKHKEQTAA